MLIKLNLHSFFNLILNSLLNVMKMDYQQIDSPEYKKSLSEKREFNLPKRSKNVQYLESHQLLVRNYISRYTPYDNVLLYHFLGQGKCMKRDTPILMYDGSIKMIQDIKENELVMGDDSTPRRVLSLARGEDLMYDIIPVKGEKYTVNSEHILCLKASGFPRFIDSKKK